MQEGPLAGLRVVDLTDDSGRFATKMLAECGASVVRVGRGSPGPAMRAADAADRGGLLDWWYDGGKACASVDLESDQGGPTTASWPSWPTSSSTPSPPGRLAEWRVDHADLVAVNPRLVQVSLTPFGRTGPRAGWQTSDLVAAALGGPLSVCGLPDEPIAVWGRQAFNFGGFHAVICGLAGVRAARVTGAGQHVDLSLHEVVCSSLEQLWFQYWFDDLLPYPKIAARQGSVHWSRAYVVVPARSGWVLVTPTPVPANLFKWMLESGFTEVNDLLAIPLEELLTDVPRIMKTIASFAQTIDAPELFWQAQERHVAFGEVQTVAHLAENPQHHFRHFFRDVAWDGSRVRVPGPLARFSATPAPAPQPPENIPAAVDEIIAGWGEPARAGHRATGSLRKPLEGVRVLDFTHVLAGPHANRIFGDLGADIVKLSTAERSVSVNDPDMPFYYTWNRSKRAASLNMKHEQATDVVRRLLEHSDVMMENFSPGVLDRWGLSYETVRQWNPRIVYVTMSGCGHHGPWSHLVTYAPTIHVLCGITVPHATRPGRGDVGPGFSVNDHAAGLSAAVAVLAALEARERTGEGQHVDISQMETGAYLIGPAVLNDLTNAAGDGAAGQRRPLRAPRTQRVLPHIRRRVAGRHVPRRQ